MISQIKLVKNLTDEHLIEKIVQQEPPSAPNNLIDLAGRL